MVENGEAAVLRWEGSDAKYTMHWGDTPAGVSLDKERVWPTPRGLTTVTGFMLRAEVTAGGSTLTHTLTTAVTVRIPDLVVRNLTVQGPATFADNVSLSNTAKDLTVAGSVRGAGSSPLRVSQPAGLKVDAALSVHGSSTFADNVAVTGSDTTTVTVTGSLRGAGSKPLRISQPAGLKVDAALNVAGASTFDNNVTVATGKTLRAAWAGPVRRCGPGVRLTRVPALLATAVRAVLRELLPRDRPHRRNPVRTGDRSDRTLRKHDQADCLCRRPLQLHHASGASRHGIVLDPTAQGPAGLDLRGGEP